MSDSPIVNPQPVDSHGDSPDPPWGRPCAQGSGCITPLMPSLQFSWYDPGGLNGASTTTPIEKWVGPENFEMYFNAHRRLTWNCPVDSEPMRPMHGYHPPTKPGPVYSSHSSYKNTYVLNLLEKYFSAEPWYSPSTTDLEPRWRYDQSKDSTTAPGGGRRSMFWPPAKWYIRDDVFPDYAEDGWQWTVDWAKAALETRPCSWVWEDPGTALLFHHALHDGSPDEMDYGRGGWSITQTWEESDSAWTGTKDGPTYNGRNWTDGHHYEGTPFAYAAYMGSPFGYIALWKLWSIYNGLHKPAPGVSFTHGDSDGKWDPMNTQFDSPFFNLNVLIHAKLCGFDNADPDMLKNFACGEYPWGPTQALDWCIANILGAHYGGDNWKLNDSGHPSRIYPWVAGKAVRCGQVEVQGRIRPDEVPERIDPSTGEWYYPTISPPSTNYGRVPTNVKNYAGWQVIVMKYAGDMYDRIKADGGFDLFNANYRQGIEDFLGDFRKFIVHITPHSRKVRGDGMQSMEPGAFGWTTPHFGNHFWQYGDEFELDSGFGVTADVATTMRADSERYYNSSCSGDWKSDWSRGWYAKEYLEFRWELDTAPGEYLFGYLTRKDDGRAFDASNLAFWSTQNNWWTVPSIGGSSTVLSMLPGALTILGPNHPLAKAIVANTAITETLDGTVDPDKSGQYGWPSISTKWSNLSTAGWEELCTWLDWFVKEWRGEAENTIIDLANDQGDAHGDATDPSWDSGDLNYDISANIGDAHGQGIYDEITPPAADAHGDASSDPADRGNVTVDLSGAEVDAHGDAEAELSEDLTPGIADVYRDASGSVTMGGETSVNIEPADVDAHGDGINPSVKNDDDFLVSPEEGQAYGDAVDPTITIPNITVDLSGAEVDAHGDASSDPGQVNYVFAVAEVADVHATAGVSSPEFDYDLSFNTTGEEYTLGGT